MRIALDYDGTVTADPVFWRVFVTLASAHGHEVHIVTMRWPAEPIDPATALAVKDRVHYTGHQFKMPEMLRRGLAFDIWIDDSPGMVTGGGDVLQWGDTP
jgi:hypothetical protein